MPVLETKTTHSKYVLTVNQNECMSIKYNIEQYKYILGA